MIIISLIARWKQVGATSLALRVSMAGGAVDLMVGGAVRENLDGTTSGPRHHQPPTTSDSSVFPSDPSGFPVDSSGFPRSCLALSGTPPLRLPRPLSQSGCRLPKSPARR